MMKIMKMLPDPDTTSYVPPSGNKGCLGSSLHINI